MTLTGQSANTKWWVNLEGSMRCDTAYAVAKYSTLEGCPSNTVVLAYSGSCSDSLVASNLRVPFLYIETENQAAINYIYNYGAVVSTILVAGSQVVVPDPWISTCINKWGEKRRSGDYGIPGASACVGTVRT